MGDNDAPQSTRLRRVTIAKRARGIGKKREMMKAINRGRTGLTAICRQVVSRKVGGRRFENAANKEKRRERERPKVDCISVRRLGPFIYVSVPTNREYNDMAKDLVGDMPLDVVLETARPWSKKEGRE